MLTNQAANQAGYGALLLRRTVAGEALLTGWAMPDAAQPDLLPEIAFEAEGGGHWLLTCEAEAAPGDNAPAGSRLFACPLPLALRDGVARRVRAWHLGTGRELPGSPLTLQAEGALGAASEASRPAGPPLDRWLVPLAGHIGGMPATALTEGLWASAEKPALSLRYELTFVDGGKADTPPARAVRLLAEAATPRIALHWLPEWLMPAPGETRAIHVQAWLPEATEPAMQAQVEVWLSRRDGAIFTPLRRLRRSRIFRRPALVEAELSVTAEEAAAGRLWISLVALQAKGLASAPPCLGGVPEPETAPRMEDWRLQSAFHALAGLVRAHGDAAAESHPLLPLSPPAGLSLAVPAEAAAGWHPFTQVILPVYNGDTVVRRCLRALSTAATGPIEVVIIDDGSRDLTAAMLREEAARDPRLVLHRRDINRGYTKSINEGVLMTRADWVVVLNSDTVVSRGWLDRLFAAARARPGTGMAGPLSNAATWQSIPAVRGSDGGWSTNDVIEARHVERVQALLTASSERAYPEFPLLNGFCTLIARDVFDHIGLYDEEAFPVGYGEETDLCLRARRAGFRLAVADDCFVYHEKSVSFGSANRSRLTRAGGLEMTNKHLGVTIPALEQRMQNCPPMARLRARMMDLLTELD